MGIRRMRGLGIRVALAAALVLIATVVHAQKPARRPPAPRPAPPPAPAKIPAPITCPSVLGVGVTTKRTFCDVLTGRDPAGGIRVTVPPHSGPATLLFDLHNRHTYSEQQVRARRAYARYTATIGVLTTDNTLIERAVVDSEFRTAADLVDRISGGAGPGGVKAVAPTGTEPVTVTIPAGEDTVSILGEKLTVVTLDGTDTYVASGRPIAVISNVMVEYQPAPPPRKR